MVFKKFLYICIFIIIVIHNFELITSSTTDLSAEEQILITSSTTDLSAEEQILLDPIFFQNEICSFNGEIDYANADIDPVTKYYINLKCICNQEYTNDPKQTLKINGNLIQCSYQKKRLFITLFLSIFIPVGFDHFYLGNNIAFALIFLLFCFTVIGNMYRFAISPEDDYLKNKVNLVFFVFIFIFIFVWIGNVFFIKFYGKDINGNELVDDFDLLLK